MRELVFTRRLVIELSEQIQFKLNGVSNVSTYWEDNIGDQNMANDKGPIMSSLTNHIGIK